MKKRDFCQKKITLKLQVTFETNVTWPNPLFDLKLSRDVKITKLHYLNKYTECISCENNNDTIGIFKDNFNSKYLKHVYRVSHLKSPFLDILFLYIVFFLFICLFFFSLKKRFLLFVFYFLFFFAASYFSRCFV